MFQPGASRTSGSTAGWSTRSRKASSRAEEREPVQRVAVRRLRAPDALDRGGQPLDGVRFESILHDDEAVPVEIFPPHVAIYGRGCHPGPETPRARRHRLRCRHQDVQASPARPSEPTGRADCIKASSGVAARLRSSLFEGGASPPEASSSVWPPPHRGRPVTLSRRPRRIGAFASTVRVSLQDLASSITPSALDCAASLTFLPLRRSQQVDWDEVRARTEQSPFAQAFFTLVEELRIVERAADTA